MGLGYVEGVTHDYFHHGTTRLFAAQAPAPGAPQLSAKDRQRGAQGARSAPDRRQLLHPQARQSEGLAGAATAVFRPLHTNLCLLA